MIRLGQTRKVANRLLLKSKVSIRYQSSSSSNQGPTYEELKHRPEPKVAEFPDMDQYHVLHKGAYNKIKNQHKKEEERAKTGVPKDYIEENKEETTIKVSDSSARPIWAQPELKKISIFQKYLLWHFSKNFQSKYKSWRDVPDHLPMVDRKAMQHLQYENPEKAAEIKARVKADMIQKFGVGGMFMELFGYFMMFGAIVIAYRSTVVFNNWAEEHIGKSSLSNAEFFKEAMKVAWEHSSLTDPVKLAGAMWRYKQTAEGTYNVDGSLNRELGEEHAKFLFSQEPIVKKYETGLELLKERTNITSEKKAGKGWVEDESLDLLVDLTKTK